MAKKIDYSKRPKGTSKREWYAQKTGGKLDYKTGKVTVKKVKTPSPPKYQGASSDEETAQLRSGLYADGQQYGPAYNAPEFSYETYDTKNMFDKDQREKASKVKSDDGTQKSSYSAPSLKPTTTRNTTAGNIFKGVTNALKATSPIASGIGSLLSRSGIDLSNFLGIDSALASDSGLANYVDDRGQVLGVQDQRTADRRQNPQDISSVLDRGQGPINFPGITDRQITQPDKPDNRRPSQVDNPYQSPVPPITPQVPSIYENFPQSQPQYGQNQGEQGTVDRMGGQGRFSTGEFGNGAGGYGFSGVVGTPQDNEQSLLNKLLGIPTANAFEMPQQPMGNLQDYYSTSARTALGIPQQSQATGQFAPGANFREQPGITGGAQQQTTGGSQGVQQGNFNQPTPQPQQPQGVDFGKQQKQQEKLFKQQEKAQKKALDELIKGIKAQYGQSRTEGTESLEKSKQQNLLRLSGLFGFAGQDPNSEQRAQYEGRAQTESASQLSDFLANLSRGQSQDISGARQGYQGQLADIGSQRQQVMQGLQQQQAEQDMQMQQLMAQSQGGGRAVSPQSTKAPSHNDIFQWVNNAVSQGGSWQEIADQAASQGIDTSTGSYLDKLLNNIQKQNQWQ